MALISSPPPPAPTGAEATAAIPKHRHRRWPQFRRLTLAAVVGAVVLVLWAALAPIRGPVTPQPVLDGTYAAGYERYVLRGERVHLEGDTVYVWTSAGSGGNVLIGAACNAGLLAKARGAMPQEFAPPVPGSIGAAIFGDVCAAVPITPAARLRYRSERLWAGLPWTREPCRTAECALADLRKFRAERAARLKSAAPARVDSTLYIDSLMPR